MLINRPVRNRPGAPQPRPSYAILPKLGNPMPDEKDVGNDKAFEAWVTSLGFNIPP